MDKFKGKYRNESIRLQNWDYGWAAAYFVTICTKDRECFFGDVVDGVMRLSAIGEIAESEWLKTFEMRLDMNLTMGEFVVMPNHFHAIIGIGKNEYNSGDNCGDTMHCVPTIGTTTGNQTPKNRFGPQSKNLASIIRGFKIGVTRNARKINPAFAWQSRFHDHIIRNEASFHRITRYIQNNPANWQGDTIHPDNREKNKNM